jgi:hypothetical protein
MAVSLSSVPQTHSRRPLLFYLLGVALFAYLLCFILPAVPIYQGDNAPVFLLDASRMARGEVLYRDIFQLTWPGTEWFYLRRFATFGERAWIPAVTLIVIATGMAWAGVAVSRRVLNGATAFLPATVFLAFAFSHALDATHHWFSLVLTLAALTVLMEQRTVKRLLVAGVLCGFATMCTQTRGALVAASFAIYLIWEWRNRKAAAKWLVQSEAALLAGYLAACLPLVALPISQAGWRPFIEDTILFPLRWYSYFGRNNLGVYMADVPDLTGLLEIPAVAIWLFIHLLTPLAYLLFFARYGRTASSRPGEPWDRLVLVNFTGLAWFATIASAPNWFKIASASLPALIIFVYLVGAEGRAGRNIRGALWIAATGAAIVSPAIAQLDWRGELQTPAGRIALFDSVQYAKFEWFGRHTRPDDTLFEAGDTDLYFPLRLKNPSEVPFMTPTDYTRPDQVARTLANIETLRVRYVVWSPWLDLADPALRAGDHLGPLRDLLRRDYRVVMTFEDGDQVWERK